MFTKKLNRQLASSSGKHNEKLVSIKVSKADANPHLGDGERLTKILSSCQPEAPGLLRVLEEGEVDEILPHVDVGVGVDNKRSLGHHLPSIYKQRS